MPLVTATVQKPKSRAFKDAVLAGVHRALVASGVPEADRFQRVIELDAEGLRFDPRYPDLEALRDANYTLIEILWSVGRSVKIKRKVVADIVANLRARARLSTLVRSWSFSWRRPGRTGRSAAGACFTHSRPARTASAFAADRRHASDAISAICNTATQGPSAPTLGCRLPSRKAAAVPVPTPRSDRRS